MDHYDQLAETAKAISHPARLKIIMALQEGEACVCHLEHLLGFRQAYISQQLARLKETGLVSDEREGLNVFYQLVDPSILTLFTALQRVTEAIGKDSELELTLPHDREGCTCPKCSTKCCE